MARTRYLLTFSVQNGFVSTIVDIESQGCKGVETVHPVNLPLPNERQTSPVYHCGGGEGCDSLAPRHRRSHVERLQLGSSTVSCKKLGVRKVGGNLF